MKWNSVSLSRLIDVVNLKYERDFRDDSEGWFRYLKSLDIKREPYRVLWYPQYEDHLWMECPWSVHNSTPGIWASKWNIFIHFDLAEKILVLGEMPVV